MSPVPSWILYHDALLRRKAFAGPYDDQGLLGADMARLEKAGHWDVEVIRARSIGRWMPPLKIALGLAGPEIRKTDGRLRVAPGWDAVERAFRGQYVKATACDGEEFLGEVTGVDLAGRFIWICVD